MAAAVARVSETLDHEEAMRPKARRVLEAARHLFLTEIYDLVTMDMIANSANVSKATLYAHFPSKEKLFERLILAECAMFEQRFDFSNSTEGHLDERLYRLGTALLAAVADEETQCVYRLLGAEVRRFPALARAVEQAGPASLRERLKTFLGGAVDAGLLRIEDPDLAAEQFFSLTMGRVTFDGALGLPPPPADMVEKQVRGAVAMFLSHYGRVATGSSPSGGGAHEDAPEGDGGPRPSGSRARS